MREIKFRGKDIATGKWLYSEFTPEKMWPTKLIDCVGEYPSEPAQNVRPETVGQYTGLKDKNGREIYEGDIIESNGARHLVTYQEEESSFMGVNPNYPKDMLTGKEFSTPLRVWWIQKFEKEVIGNIHDNPELINNK